MDYWLRESLSRERMASLLAEADRERLARTCGGGCSEPGATLDGRLLGPVRGWVAPPRVKVARTGSTRVMNPPGR